MEATLKDGENVFFRRPPPLPAWTDLNGEVRSGKTKRIREGGRWKEREREMGAVSPLTWSSLCQRLEANFS